MSKSKFLSFVRDDTKDTDATEAPLGGTREQAAHRLQVGLVGIAVMVFVIGLATIFAQRAQISEESAVPEAAPTTEPVEAPEQSDPLVDAGVVPDLPTETGEGADQGEEQAEEAEVEDTEAP